MRESHKGRGFSLISPPSGGQLLPREKHNDQRYFAALVASVYSSERAS
jgi:hypothetical protein